MPLATLKWDDPIRRVYEIAKVKINSETRNDFEAAYSRYARKLSDLSLVWSRLSSAAEAQRTYIDIVFARDKWRDKGRDPFSPEELARMDASQAKSASLSLDYEDFFIHSRILMDRVSYLTRFFLPQLRTGQVIRFSEHRRFFKNPRNIPFSADEDYARFIREDTLWFDTMLKAYRDQLVVHDITSGTGGIYMGPNSPPRLVRLRFLSMNDSKWQSTWSALMGMKSKYLQRIQGLGNVSENVYELLEFMENHADMIEPIDLKILDSIRTAAGSKLPDPFELASKIQEFLEFWGQHFYNRISSTPHDEN